MKLEARRVAAFLREPGPCRCVLLYGDDAGLIHERARQVAMAVVPDRDDPFRVAWLDRDTADRLPAEVAALALTGGRRVVRLRDATDAVLGPLRAAVEGPGEALVVAEAPDLSSRSKLRGWADKAEHVAAIGCYPDEGRSLDTTLRALLAEHGVGADADALAYLKRVLGADRAVTVGEVAKLVLYVSGPGAADPGRIDLAAAEACVGDGAALSIEDALYAATDGDVAGADRATGLALSDGGAPVGLLRAAAAHLQRLHGARLAVDGGLSATDAARAVRPPLFFRRVEPFTRALGLWSATALARAMAAVGAAEVSCKRTGAPDAAICREAVAALARHAAARSREAA